MNQTALPLDWPEEDQAAAFVVTPSTAAAVRHLDAVGTWPVCATLLTGPRKSGRSLLGRVFAQRTGGTLIDDADRRDERGLFSAWNEAQVTRRPLLMIAEVPPPEWRIALPDLRSRLSATPVVTIGDPEDEWIAAVVKRHFERRGMTLLPEVLAYIVPRSPRSHHGVIALTDALDTAALARKGGITIPLARSVLGAAIDDVREAG